MGEYISREAVVLYLKRYSEKEWNPSSLYGMMTSSVLHKAERAMLELPAADVQPVKTSKWCPPLMGQGKCDTYCERCYGKIMRNSTGIFEETPLCPHCGARMDGEQNE